MPKLTFFILLAVCSVNLCCGCSLFHDQEKAAEARERFEKKKKNYESLKKAMSSGGLKKKMTTDEILEAYGAPDDIFLSGSTSSSTEIWTYEEPVDPKIDQGMITSRPLRLYFSDSKLVSWNY